ncbi:MAG: nucleotidyltransferase [Bacteroides sp.]
MNGLQLVVLAAGMGSRYGGLKQMEGVGPSGETLLKYSVYDALRSGFEGVVFVIREAIRADFERVVLSTFQDTTPFQLAFQELTTVPAHFSVPVTRTKPWGTAHALWCAKEQITKPFAVINADDFYGQAAFEALAKMLPLLDEATPMCMVGYALGHTLSEAGSVSRGVCTVEDGYLVHIEEHTDIRRQGDVITGKNAQGREITLSEDTIVSMNCWGFAPQFMGDINAEITQFFNRQQDADAPSEVYLPAAVQRALHRGARCKVLTTSAQWCGVTYPADKGTVQALLRELVEKAVYPKRIG